MVDFYKRYSLGEREFREAQLQRVDLSGNTLSKVDLRYADLNHANLKNANLSRVDLRKSSLIRTELSGAYINVVNLFGANLSRANMTNAILIETDLTGACLNEACFISAKLIQVDLSYADLTGTYLIGVDLSKAKLKGAFYNDDTSFPSNFNPKSAGMLQECNVEKLLVQFNHIYKCSHSFLGNKMTSKYLLSSQPDFDWFKNFEINESNQITLKEFLKDSVTTTHLCWLQKWIDNYVNSCSQIIKDFSKLI